MDTDYLLEKKSITPIVLSNTHGNDYNRHQKYKYEKTKIKHFFDRLKAIYYMWLLEYIFRWIIYIMINYNFFYK